MTDSTEISALNAPYLGGLNDRQREAVLALEGAVLVLAGAGTGKTRVLTTRLAHILTSGLAWPSQILAVTFTNKAANEMKERIGHLIGRPVEGWWLGTFHALAARILRSQAELVGLKPNFTIVSTDDQLRLVKQLIEAEGLALDLGGTQYLLDVARTDWSLGYRTFRGTVRGEESEVHLSLATDGTTAGLIDVDGGTITKCASRCP